jgi:hypothetical protein
MGPQWGKPFLHVFILDKNLLIFFSLSRTSTPISIKLHTIHPCIERIQVHINKRQSHFQRDIIAKIGWADLFFFFFSKTIKPEKLRFT